MFSRKLTLVVFILIQTIVFGKPKDSLEMELNKAILNKEFYETKKNKTIENLKKKLILSNLEEQFAINKLLYTEYKKYKIDSAIIFIEKNIKIAEKLNNEQLKKSSIIKLSNLYSSSGKYLESYQILSKITSKTLNKENLSDYYEAFSQFYEHYNTNNENKTYKNNIEVYRDSLLATLPKNSIKYKINLAQHFIYYKKIKDAKNLLLSLIETSKNRDQNYAMFTYLMGDISKIEKNTEKEKDYYRLAAISDIENCNKDNAAVQNLAMIEFEQKNIDNAYLYAQSAIADAVVCNVKFRTLSISKFYSIINTSYLQKEAKSKSQLINYLILISIISVFLAFTLFYLYKQIKKISRIKKSLSKSSDELEKLNEQIQKSNIALNEKNNKLIESNRIKEEYITQFFDICSTYITKIEDFRKSLNKQAQNKNYEALSKELKSSNFIDKELESLYHTFDVIFINLYPTFIDEFNSLLIPEEKIILKPNEILNTELRIFALIRLGITDSTKIAAFLRYSVSTIYNYRTKTRNKSAVSRDEFELMVSKIEINNSNYQN